MPSRHVSLPLCNSEGIKQDGRDVVEVNLLFLPSDVTIKSTSKILSSPRRLFICYPSLAPLKCMPVCTLSPCTDSKHQLSSNQHPPVTYPAWWTALQPPVSSGDHWVASRGQGVGKQRWAACYSGAHKHKFKATNHLIVSVLLEMISSHAKLLRVPAPSAAPSPSHHTRRCLCLPSTASVLSAALFGACSDFVHLFNFGLS